MEKEYSLFLPVMEIQVRNRMQKREIWMESKGRQQRRKQIYFLLGFILFLEIGWITGSSTAYPNENWNITSTDVFVLKFEFSSSDTVFYNKVWPNTISDDTIEGGYVKYLCSDGTLEEGTMTWSLTKSVSELAAMNTSDAWENQSVEIAGQTVDIYTGEGPALLSQFSGQATQWFSCEKGIVVKESHEEYTITLVSWTDVDMTTFGESQCPANTNGDTDPFAGIPGFNGIGMVLFSAVGLGIVFIRTKVARSSSNR